MFVKQVTIGKQVSLTFLALLEVSVGAVRGERAKSVARCCLSVKIVRSCRDIGEMQ